MKDAVIRVAGVAAPENLNVENLCKKLNKIQSYYRFDYLASSAKKKAPNPNRSHGRHSIKQLYDAFYKNYPHSRDAKYDVLLTAKRLEGVYFCRPLRKLGIASSSETEYILSESHRTLQKYFTFLVVCVLPWLQYGIVHGKEDEDVGCLFDSCYDNRDTIISGLRQCIICDDCRQKFHDKNVPNEQVKSIEKVLHWIKGPPATAIKWGLAILLLAIGSISFLLSVFPDAGLVALAASGWVAAAAGQPWPFLER